MWLLNPDCTFWFSRAGDKTRFLLRQMELVEGEYMSAQKMGNEDRIRYLLRVGIVGAEGLLDHEGKPVDFASLLVPRGDLASARDLVLPAEFVRRIPNAWAQEMVAQIAMGPQTPTDEGN